MRREAYLDAEFRANRTPRYGGVEGGCLAEIHPGPGLPTLVERSYGICC